MKPSLAATDRSPSLPGWVLLLFAALCAWLQAWTPPAFHARLLAPQAADYYHEYADALLHGQLHLAREPDPGLVALPDPYDPTANAPYRVNDLSYRAGHYYLYHSIVPALTVFAPVRAVTGRHLSVTWACWFFCVVGTCAALWIVWDYRRACAPGSSRLLLLLGGLAVAFCQGAYVVLRQGTTNTVPIACAYAFAMLALMALWRAQFLSGARCLRWLAWGSLAAGLAVASRPNYAFGAAGGLLLAGLTLAWRAETRARRIALLLAAGLPAAACVTALLFLNFIRFGDPLEFGMRYMLGGWDQRQLPALAWTNVRANLDHYLFAPGVHHAIFPFVTPPSWTSLGVLLYVPVLWLAPFGLHAWWHGTPAARRFGLMLACLGLVNFAVLVLLPSGNQANAPTSANTRYLLDFLPCWVLASSLAAVSLGQRLAAAPRRRRIFLGAAGLLTAASLLAAASLDLARYPRESIRPLARWLSQPAWWLERLHGTAYGPLALDLTFPQDRTGGYEPLLAVGDATAGDLVYVFYESRTTARFGLVSSGRAGPLSEPVPLDYTAGHRLELHLGPLNPPVSHPLLAGLPEEVVARLSRRFRLRLDGQSVLDVPVAFAAAGGAPVQAGQAPFLRDYAAAAFTGSIQRLERLPLTAGLPPAAATAYGALRLTLDFPTTARATEPLLATGIPQAGDVLYVEYLGGNRLRFGLDHWGHHGWQSAPVAYEPGRSHELIIAHGALFPPDNHPSLAQMSTDLRHKLKQRLVLTLDGSTVADIEQPTFDASPYDVHLGRNTLGASSCTYLFSGTILQAERLPLPAR